MKERLIINGYEIAGRMPVFQQWGWQAIRDDRKTQTRRPLRKQPLYVDETPRYLPNEWCLWDGECSPNGDIVRCPYGKPGDIRVMTEPLIMGHSPDSQLIALYMDDMQRVVNNQTGECIPWRWKNERLPSLFMPYEAARTLTRYTNVRVERLQEISVEDVQAEGCTGSPFGELADKMLFPTLWDSLNAKRGYSWESNPYVWVVEFERIK